MCAGDGLALCVSPSKDGIAGCGVSEGYETRAPIPDLYMSREKINFFVFFS